MPDNRTMQGFQQRVSI